MYFSLIKFENFALKMFEGINKILTVKSTYRLKVRQIIFFGKIIFPGHENVFNILGFLNFSGENPEIGSKRPYNFS